MKLCKKRSRKIIFVSLVLLLFSGCTSSEETETYSDGFDYTNYKSYSFNNLELKIPKTWIKLTDTNYPTFEYLTLSPLGNFSLDCKKYDYDIKEKHEEISNELFGEYEELDSFLSSKEYSRSKYNLGFDIKACVFELKLESSNSILNCICFNVFNDNKNEVYRLVFTYADDEFSLIENEVDKIINSITFIEEDNKAEQYNEQTYINSEEIYNNNGIQISTSKIAYDKKNEQICIYYSVVNNSSKDIKISVDNIDVNGYTFAACKGKNSFGRLEYDEAVNEVIYKNSTLSSKICFNISNLKYTSLKKFQYFKFYLNIRNLNYDSIDRKYIEIFTNQYESYEEDYSFFGQTVYESDSYKCYVKPYSSTNTENSLVIYVENNTTNTLSWTYNGIIINGNSFGDLTLASGIQVLPNSHYIGLVDFQYLYSFAGKEKPSKLSTLSMYIEFIPTRSNGYMMSSDFINSEGVTVVFD